MKSHVGTYRLKSIPFCPMNTPATFHGTLYILLTKCNSENCLVYLYDGILFSKDEKSHSTDIENIFDILRKSGISLKSHENSDRCSASTNLHMLRSLLVICNVYRQFVPRLNNISAILHGLLKKDMSKTFDTFGKTKAAASLAL